MLPPSSMRKETYEDLITPLQGIAVISQQGVWDLDGPVAGFPCQVIGHGDERGGWSSRTELGRKLAKGQQQLRFSHQRCL